MKNIYIVIIFITLIFNDCFAQADVKNPKNNYGFFFSGLSRNFIFKNNYLSSKDNVGFGLGLFYIRKLSNSVNFNIELQSNYEFHKIIYNSSEYKIKEKNLVIPIQIQYQFNQSHLSIIGGLAYQFRDKQVSDEFQLKKHNYSIPIGLNYIILLERVKIIPEIKYSFGLNNAITVINLPNYSGNIYGRNNGFVATIKIM